MTINRDAYTRYPDRGPARLLLVQSNRSALTVMAKRMGEAGFRIIACDNPGNAAAEMHRAPVDLVLAEAAAYVERVTHDPPARGDGLTVVTARHRLPLRHDDHAAERAAQVALGGLLPGRGAAVDGPPAVLRSIRKAVSLVLWSSQLRATDMAVLSPIASVMGAAGRVPSMILARKVSMPPDRAFWNGVCRGKLGDWV